MDRFEEVPFPVQSFSPANDRRCLSAVKARIAQTRQVSANKGLPERVGSTTPRYVNLVSPRSRHLNLLHSRSPSPSLLASPPFPLFRSLNRLQPSQSIPESGSFSQAGVDFNPFSSYRFSARDEHERRGGPKGGLCALGHSASTLDTPLDRFNGETLPGHLSSPSSSLPPHGFLFALLLAEGFSSGSKPQVRRGDFVPGETGRERSSSIGPLVETLAQADLQAESPKSRGKEG